MKTLVEYLDRHKHKRLKQVYNYFPKTNTELKSIIEERIKNEGEDCDLNDIDVSRVKNMSSLFRDSNFNGDISKWDVSNVGNMTYMFGNSKFNGDISGWDVSKVKNMNAMFYKSNFNGDISDWNVSKVREMYSMFTNSPLEKNPPKWYK